MVQRKLDKSSLRLRDLAFGKEFFLGIVEISEMFLEMRQSRVCETAAARFRRYPSWLSPAEPALRHSRMGWASAVPTSVSPTDDILVSPFIIVKFLFIMMPAFWLCDILRQRLKHYNISKTGNQDAAP